MRSKLQFWKTLSPKPTTDAGIIIVVRFTQPLNARSSMDFIVLGRTMDDACEPVPFIVETANAYIPIEVTVNVIPLYYTLDGITYLSF